MLFFKKLSLGDLSQNIFAEFWFIKIIAVVMIIGVVTDFEMTFTGDLFKIAWKKNDFVFIILISQKKFDYGPLKNSGERSRAIFALLLRMYPGQTALKLHKIDLVDLSESSLIIIWVPRGSVVKCLTSNPGVLGSSLTGSSGFFRGSVLGQDTSEPSLVLVKPRKAWIMWIVAVIWLKYC